MKKKLLLLLTTSLTLSAAISALAITSSKGPKFSTIGQDEPVAFYIDYSTVEAATGDNTYQVLFKSVKGHSFRVMVEGVSFRNNYFYSNGTDHDFLIYNIDPIRGIYSSELNIVLPSESDERIQLQSMFSYNQIEFDEVLNGKYQDLSYSTESHWGSTDITFNPVNTPSLLSSRYFLYRVHTRSSNAKIELVSAESVCGAPIPGDDDIGENLGVLSEQEKADMNVNFDGCLSLQNMGNPTYELTNTTIYQYYDKNAECAPIIDKLINEQGFTLTYNEPGAGITLYQKRDGDKVHTFMERVEEYDFCKFTRLSYDSYYGYFETFSDWPSEFISNELTSLHQDYIPVLSSEIRNQYFSSYVATAMAEGSYKMIMIACKFKVESTEQAALTIMNSFMSQFDTTLWELYDHSIEALDGFLYVYFDYEGGDFLIEMEETILNDTPPTASQIADLINYDNSEDIYVQSGGEGALYELRYSSYYIYNYAEDTFDNAMLGFTNAGYTITSYSTNQFSLRKTVDAFGDYISVTVNREPNNYNSSIRIYYNYYVRSKVQCYTFYDLLYNFECYTSAKCIEVANKLTLSDTYEYYNFDDSMSGVIKNAGSEFISQFATAFASEYIEALDGYRLDDSNNYLIKLSLTDGSVLISAHYYEDVAFSDYTLFNQRMDNFVSNYGLDSSLAVHLSESDNLGNRFTSSGYKCYFATRTEAEAFEELLAQKIIANGNYTYSYYQDAYVNLDSNFAIYFGIKQNRDVFYVQVDLRQMPFEDYKSYNDLELDDIALLSYFPSFVSEAQKDEKFFIHLNVTETSVSCEVKQTSALDESYLETLLLNGFTQLEETVFGKFIDGYLYTMSFGFNTKTYTVTFAKEGPYLTHDELFTSIGTTDSDFLDSFGFSTIFNSNEKVYEALDFTSTKKVRVGDKTAVDNYKAYLLSNGYELKSIRAMNVENCYIKSNSAQDNFMLVTIEDHGSISDIEFSTMNIPFTSWSNLVTSVGVNHNFEFNEDYVIYPDDGVGSLYMSEQMSPSILGVVVNRNYDIDAYISRIVNDERYLSMRSYEFYKEYNLTYGRITIFDLGLYYYVVIQCNKYKGDTFEDYIIATVGSTNIEVRGSLTYFKFVPDQNATFNIYTTSTFDTYGYLYDENGNEITHNDDGGENTNFLINASLEKGKTYYIGVRLYSSGSTSVNSGVLTIEVVE